MIPYARPAVVEETFRDASGAVIPYGDRWGAGPPPDDTYSVLSNPARFAPLHTVADALIEHLAAGYDVLVEDDAEVANDLRHRPDDVVRAVRLTPSDPDAASLTFVLTSFPSVLIHAGLLHDLHFPVCGCDACDETWDALADEMEWQVFAVVGGRYREGVQPDAELGVTYALSNGDDSGRIGGRSRPVDHERTRLVAAAERLSRLPAGWRPWPLRNSSG